VFDVTIIEPRAFTLTWIFATFARTQKCSRNWSAEGVRTRNEGENEGWNGIGTKGGERSTEVLFRPYDRTGSSRSCNIFKPGNPTAI